MRPEGPQISAQYSALAKQQGINPTQMALAWCYQQWFVASTIIGATSLAQLKENIDAFDLHLSDELIASINAIHAKTTNPAQ